MSIEVRGIEDMCMCICACMKAFDILQDVYTHIWSYVSLCMRPKEDIGFPALLSLSTVLTQTEG